MELHKKYYNGILWLPTNESNKISCSVYIDGNGDVTIISLQSLTKDLDIARGEEWEVIDLIVGYIKYHDESTVYTLKLYETHKIQESRGFLKQNKYKSRNSFISLALDQNIYDRKYGAIMLGSNEINKWIPISGFDFTFGESEAFEVNHLYKQPPKIDLFKNDKYYIYIFFRATSSTPVRRKSQINEEVFINIELFESVEIKEIYKVKSIIERLLNIILFIPFQSTTTEFKTESHITYRSLQKHNEFIPVIGKSIEFKAFKENSQKIFNSWFEKQYSLDLFIKNFFSVYGQKGVLIENRFLTYISALENYHKNNIRKKGNLKDRLFELINNSNIKSDIEDVEKYAEKLKTTRNYYIHLEEKHEKNALKIPEIIKANLMIEILIRELMLKEIGILDKLIV